MRPLVFHDWRAVAATVTTLGACAIVMRAVWTSRPRIAASGADRRHLGRYTRGLAAVHVLALGAPLVAPGLTLPGSPGRCSPPDWRCTSSGRRCAGGRSPPSATGSRAPSSSRPASASSSRDPIAWSAIPPHAGGILRAAGLGFVLDNWLSLALLVAGMTAFVAVRIRREESILVDGLEPYSAYRRRTARLVPGIW